MRRVRIKPAASRELLARYRAREEAERNLTAFLAGVTLSSGFDPEKEELSGFDDTRHELIFEDRPPAD